MKGIIRGKWIVGYVIFLFLAAGLFLFFIDKAESHEIDSSISTTCSENIYFTLAKKLEEAFITTPIGEIEIVPGQDTLNAIEKGFQGISRECLDHLARLYFQAAGEFQRKGFRKEAKSSLARAIIYSMGHKKAVHWPLYQELFLG